MYYVKGLIKIIASKIWILSHIRNKKNIQYFFCPSGIGDTLYVASYMKEYRKSTDKKIVFIIKKSHKQLCDMYNNDIDDTIIITPFYFKTLFFYLKTCLRYNDIILAHPLKLMYDPCKILGINNICLLDFYKVLLNLPLTTNYIFPETNLEIKEKVLEKIQLYDNKNILLCPYCVSISMTNFDISLWNDIAKKYLSLGYNVFTNVKDETELPIDGTKPLQLNLEELYSIIDNFSCVYSVRNGLCDLLAFSKVKLVVFYPYDNINKVSNSYNIYNFKNIGIRSDIVDIIMDDKQKVLNAINNIINK